MAAPTVTKCNPEDVQSIGSLYQEAVKLVVDGSTATLSFAVGTHTTMVGYIKEIIGCNAVIAADGRSAAISGLPLSSTLQILVRGLPGI